MKKSVIFWSWIWLLTAHVADVCTSLQRWGADEENPYFRDAAHKFLAWHAVVGKSTYTLILAAMSYLTYRLVAPFDKRLATFLACAGPLLIGWQIWMVANNNLFVILKWINQ